MSGKVLLSSRQEEGRDIAKTRTGEATIAARVKIIHTHNELKCVRTLYSCHITRITQIPFDPNLHVLQAGKYDWRKNVVVYAFLEEDR